MLRRMMIELIRNDPEYQNGNYTTQPRFLKLASVFFGMATSGGTLNYQELAPTNQKADQLVDARLAAPMNADANDYIWAWNSSADYDPAPKLESIRASVLAINSADDERNPPESGIEVAALDHVKNAKLYVIPASAETRGHSTTAMAKFYSQQLQEFLSTAPQRAM
jgi:homoserine O-acetyltransferase/O-succinyltransferase